MKFLSSVLFAVSASLVLTTTAQANEIFAKNCASCHAGGKNIMNAEKDLSQASLEKNGVATLDAIKNLVSNGKAPMPGFSSSLSEAQIAEVSQYVLDQAKKGW